MSGPAHAPVLVERVVALLTPALERPGAVFVDATLGQAGHSAAVLAACPAARLVGIDRDAEALDRARTHLTERLAAAPSSPGQPTVSLMHASYEQIREVLTGLRLDRADGVLFDLGVSSMQLDQLERGFAYSFDAPLDMRMDQRTGTTAADVLNTYSAQDLTRILRSYGEERFARRIAESIVRERNKQPFSTSGRLVDVLREAIPAAARHRGGNPAKRTFQALRIEVNDELASLYRALPAAIDVLAVGGRMVVLSYHSLEDRFVKRSFASRARPDVPDALPVVPAAARPQLRLLTRGAERAGPDEMRTNPRATSVRLRAVERIREAA